MPDGWKEFKHPDGAYRIFVPGTPQLDRTSAASLEPKKPLGPQEVRVSLHHVSATAKQPFICTMEVTLFHPGDRSLFERNINERPPDNLNRKVTDFRPVTWAGHRAWETVVEKTFLKGPNEPPLRFYTVGRYMVTANRMYLMAIERTDRMPTAAEYTAFFDSLVEEN